MKIEIEGTIERKRILGILFFFLLYLRFSEVEISKFYYQDKTVIVEKGFLKISV